MIKNIFIYIHETYKYELTNNRLRHITGKTLSTIKPLEIRNSIEQLSLK